MLPSLFANYESRFPAYRREISECMAEGFHSSVPTTHEPFDLHNKYPAACLHTVGLDASSHWDTAAKLINNCWGKNQQSVPGQFSIGRDQFSISVDNSVHFHSVIPDRD
jgi:hypothetical protein